ncbi:MAG: glycosyltransferase, partial [Victivallales bacterium]|nr:glycosyltransferase [Victivallales bacterium]
MENRPKFTIITPAYETERFIDKMAESLKAQTLNDFECLLIVEESKDNSLGKCQEIANGDGRFRVFALPKSGSGSAS